MGSIGYSWSPLTTTTKTVLQQYKDNDDNKENPSYQGEREYLNFNGC
jgi:hypothetical protein